MLHFRVYYCFIALVFFFFLFVLVVYYYCCILITSTLTFISLALPMNLRLFVRLIFLRLTACDDRTIINNSISHLTRNQDGHWVRMYVYWWSWVERTATPLEPQSRFGDKLLDIWMVCPQNGTAVLKGLMWRQHTTIAGTGTIYRTVWYCCASVLDAVRQCYFPWFLYLALCLDVLVRV